MPGVETHRGWAMGKGQEMARPYLAALTSDTAVVITGRLVPTHDTLLVFVQVTRDIPWEGGKGGGSGHGAEPGGGTSTVPTQLCLPPFSPRPTSLKGGSLSQSRKEKSWRHRGGRRGRTIHLFPFKHAESSLFRLPIQCPPPFHVFIYS